MHDFDASSSHFDCIYSFYSNSFINNGAVSEWLRRWIRNPLCFTRVGSNPAGTVPFAFFAFAFFAFASFFSPLLNCRFLLLIIIIFKLLLCCVVVFSDCSQLTWIVSFYIQVMVITVSI